MIQLSSLQALLLQTCQQRMQPNQTTVVNLMHMLHFYMTDELVYASYLGGAGDDYVMGMSVNDETIISILGYTSSESLVVQNPIQNQFGGVEDAVIWIFAPPASTDTTKGTSELPILLIIAIGVTCIVVIIIVSVEIKRI